MHKDALERLRRANPLPELLPGLPLEAIRRRLDEEPPSSWRPHRPAPRSTRRVTHAIPIVMSMLVVVAVATFALTVGASHRSRSRPGDTRPAHTGQTTSTSRGRDRGLTPADAFLDLLMPRDGTDYTNGAKLNEFTVRVSAKAETACLAAKGLPGPPPTGPVSAPFGGAQYPNMAAIAKFHNGGAITTRGAPVDPAGSLSPVRRKIYEAAVSHCAVATQQIEAFYNSPAATRLMSDWQSIYTTVARSSSMRSATRQGAACSRKTEFPAANATQEIGNIEAKLTPLNIRGKRAKADALNASGARVLVTCFGPVEALRGRLLAAQRANQLTRQADQITQLETQVNREISIDEARYHLQFP